jgi:hypothetical protein
MLRRIVVVSIVPFLLAPAFGPPVASAGVVNPDISVIGQPFARWTDDAADPARKRVGLDVGETEFVFDAYLNPYARGTFVGALGDEGFELEEGYFQMLRGLPANLGLKAGKYRIGFGKLNPVHPHAYPFAERFRVLATYLPGEESFNETAIQLSELVALGSASLTVSADWLEGGSFRIEREPSGASNDPLETDPDAGDRQGEPRPAGLGRLSAFVPFTDISGIELGISGTSGTNNVAAHTRTTVVGADAKAKLWTGPRSYLVLQSEVLHLDREEAGWDETAAVYAKSSVEPTGGYLFADYNWNTRYNAGASYERWQQPTADKTWDQAFGVYAGLALMEETTAFRISWDRYRPGRPPGATEDPDVVNAFTLRLIYSMGPHKAHQF